MATKGVRRLSNLGYPVTTSIISWEQAVREAEGSRWDLPFAVYFFGDEEQRVFVSYNLAITGPPSNVSTQLDRITQDDEDRLTMDGFISIIQ